MSVLVQMTIQCLKTPHKSPKAAEMFLEREIMQKFIDLQRFLRAKTTEAQRKRAGSATEKYYGFNSEWMMMKQTCGGINSCAPMGKAVTRFITRAQPKSLPIGDSIHLRRETIQRVVAVALLPILGQMSAPQDDLL